MERVTGRLILPFVLVTLAGTVLTGCWMHGFSTVYLLFGPEEAERLLAIDNGLHMSSNWGLSLPLIPMVLIAARTQNFDNILPIIPIFYFASNSPRRDAPLWPPSAAFTVATLPYIRAAYNEFYSRVLAPKEKAWIEVIKPRAGEDSNGEGQEQEPQNQEDQIPEGVGFALDFQVEIVDDGEAEGEQQQEQQQGQQPVGDAPAEEQGEIQDQGQNQHHDHPHPHQVPANQGGIVGGNFFLDAIVSTQMVIGALVFPTVSAAMGVLLKVVLPRALTTPPSRWDRYPAGFLQSRFGRSVAGGCLFVALRDTLLLYSKYRLAQDHKKRRVVDYDRKKGKKAGTSRG